MRFAVSAFRRFLVFAVRATVLPKVVLLLRSRALFVVILK